MFTLADMTRVNKFHWLPQWARKWFKSLSPKDLYVYFEYTLYFIIHSFPICARFKYYRNCSLSSVGDGDTSVVGKSMENTNFQLISIIKNPLKACQ